MHLFLFTVFFIIVALLIREILKRSSGGQSGLATTGADVASSDDSLSLVYLSRGMLFHSSTPDAKPVQIHSAHVQELLDRAERQKSRHGWKQDTAWSQNFIAGSKKEQVSDKHDIRFAGVQFKSADSLIYFLRDDNFGGLYEYRFSDATELRLLHQQNLIFEDLHYHPEKDRLLCSSTYENAVSNIVLMDGDGNNQRELTGGDSRDTAPAWVGAENQIVFQSQGIARSEEGYVMAYGPASLQLLDVDSNEMSTVLESQQYDFLSPRVCSSGNLYFVNRPYEAVKYAAGNFFLDLLLFPFRLARAVFHYLNIFSLMYSRKPLTSAGGPKLQQDAKTLFLQGRRIDAEKALNTEKPVNGVPSLVPASWQLVRRDKNGQDVVLAQHVVAFEILDNDDVLYTNGCGVFRLTAKGPQLLTRDNVIHSLAARAQTD